MWKLQNNEIETKPPGWQFGFLDFVHVCHRLLWNICHKVTVFWLYDLKDDLLKTACEDNAVLHFWWVGKPVEVLKHKASKGLCCGVMWGFPGNWANPRRGSHLVKNMRSSVSSLTKHSQGRPSVGSPHAKQDTCPDQWSNFHWNRLAHRISNVRKDRILTREPVFNTVENLPDTMDFSTCIFNCKWLDI